MQYLKQLIKSNGHKLTKYNKCSQNHRYISVFNYSELHGGTFDSFKYYNNYVVDIGEK